MEMIKNAVKVKIALPKLIIDWYDDDISLWGIDIDLTIKLKNTRNIKRSKILPFSSSDEENNLK